MGAALVCAVACAAGGQAGTTPASQTYVEFGTVVAISRRTVEVQVFDPALNRTVQHSFALGKETRADVVRPGETVEAIYSATTGSAGAAGEDWILRRLIALDGMPKLGPAPRAASAAAARTTTPDRAPAKTVPTATAARLPTQSGRATSPAAATAATLGGAVSATSSARPPATVALGNGSTPKVPSVNSISLGGAPDAVNPAVPRVKSVNPQPVGEQCSRAPGWATEPITLAVLDFRYPTEREESHDVGTVGGGSGTAVADLVFDRLGQGDPHLALSRGDRAKVFRMDFAGAARVGRQLGVDAVLLGTFAPVDIPNADPDFPPPTQAHTLRAGVVETCTGELLYRLTSITCPAPVAGAPAASCPGSEVTAREAAEPNASRGAFAVPIGNMLAPLVADAVPHGEAGTAGTVTAVAADGRVTLRVTGSVRAGDQVAILASRLAKNPVSNTVHVYRREEIGRVKVERVAGGTATGTFAGETATLPGDAADLVVE